MNALSPKSWSEIKSHYRFFKEVLQQRKKAEIEAMCGAEIPLATFDPFMINEAVEYLNLSMTNLLAYKRLVCGKYLAWGKVTLYYSQFYAINSLLRLRRYALVHLKFINENNKSLVIRIEKPRKRSGYVVEKCSARGHENAWSMFAQKYPELASRNKRLAKLLGRYSIKERENWNYDLFYASQNTGKYALEEADERCQNNFLDPAYYEKHSGSEEEAEYYGELMASTGFEEAGTGQHQKFALDTIEKIGMNSKHPKWYLAHLSEVLVSIQTVESSEDMKKEMVKLLTNAISKIKTDSSETFDLEENHA